MLPPLDDSLATATSEFDTYDELRAEISRHLGELLEKDAEGRFRVAAVDELLKASNVVPAELVVEVRTRDLLNAFVRQIESRGMDPVAYLRALGITGSQLEERFREEAVAVDRHGAPARGRRRQARNRGLRRRHPLGPARGR